MWYDRDTSGVKCARATENLQENQEEKNVTTVYYRKFRKWKVLLCISEYHRTGRTASGEAFLCDRAGTVYHADPEDAGGDESGKRNPEY